MSIISCPECNKQISSHAAICNYCGYHRGEVTEEDLQLFRARKLRDKIYRLNMISYAVIALFIASFCWYWWESLGFTQASSVGPFILMGIAAVAYLAVRALLFKSRQKRKSMRQAVKLSSDLRRNL
jgi:hypothetical protein